MKKMQTFIGIMAFYAFLTYIAFPLAFYYLGKTLSYAGYGFITGSIVSIILWLMVGNKMVK